MFDLHLLAWLRWRQLHGSVRYWLRLVGYEPGQHALSERLRQWYVLGFCSWWVVAMSAVAFHEAAQIGARLNPRLLALGLQALPWLVLAMQVALAVAALRSSPLKLTFPDAAYVAGAPLSRWAIVLVAWLQTVVRNIIIAVPAAAWLAVVLVQGARPALVDRAALCAALVALPLVTLVTGLAWCLGLVRMGWPQLRCWPLLWLSPFLLFGLALLCPTLCLWPGQVLTLAVAGQIAIGPLLVLALLALLSGVLLTWLGRQVHMADVLAESTTFARVHALGPVGFWLNPDLLASIRAQAALSARRPFLRLPSTQVLNAPSAHVGLTYLRRPGLLLRTLLWSAVVWQGSLCLVPVGAFAPPWLSWLLVLLLAPRRGLLDAFQTEAADPFLRQLLPVDNLRLLVADAAFPLVLLTLPAVLAWFLLGAPALVSVTGIGAVMILAVLLVLCQGVSLVKTSLGLRLPYPVAAAVSFGALLVVRAGGASPLAALVVGAGLIAMFGALIAASPVSAFPAHGDVRLGAEVDARDGGRPGGGWAEDGSV